MRKFLERLGEADYGYGWRSYEYAGHHIVGHRGGVAGYRSLILFDPQKKSGVVALWNSNTNQPGGLEFEVMDSIYHLPFRDWLELDMEYEIERSRSWQLGALLLTVIVVGGAIAFALAAA